MMIAKIRNSITSSNFLKVIGNMGFVSNKEDEVSKCLKDMDLDGDGRVSYAEFMVKWKIS
jgi:Ca2+-binding EF-hand superfamily protein